VLGVRKHSGARQQQRRERAVPAVRARVGSNQERRHGVGAPFIGSAWSI
jgi:hypothetical protein